MQNNPDSEELKKIAKVIDLNELTKYTRGIYAHNVGKLYKSDATSQDYKELKKSYNKLLAKYPLDVLKERLTIFFTTSGFVNDYNVHVDNTRIIYTRPANISLQLFRTQYDSAKPINLNLRNAVINILEGHNINDVKETNTNLSFNVLYNVVPSMIILLVISIICITKKKFVMPIVFGMQLLKALAIIVTAPDCFFMYYLPTYITGYLVLAIFIISNRKKEEKDILI